MKWEIVDFSKNHAKFHYQSSYEFLNLAIAIIKLHKFDHPDLMAFLNKAIAIYPENADAYYFRGLVKYFNGKIIPAQKDFEYYNIHKNHICEYVNEKISFPIYEIFDLEDFQTPHYTNDLIDFHPLQTDEINIHYKNAKQAFQEKNFHTLSEIYKYLSSLTSQKHFQYHVDLAEMYYHIAQECYLNNLKYEAIFFINKALETDENNIDNKKYELFKVNLLK